MKLYRFSPIKTRKQLVEAVEYVAEQTGELCEKVTGERFPVPYLTIFAHYQGEYDALVAIAEEVGETTDANNGISVALKTPITTADQPITRLRIRRPDPYRMQVGCNDFGVDDYESFKQKYLAANPNNLRLIKRPEYEMIEFFDPDYDVLAYVVSEENS